MESSLEADKFLKNKFQIKLNLYAKEILLQFLKFENLILLMQVANNNLEFLVTTEKNIVDYKNAKKNIGSILLPIERVLFKSPEEQEELILGRLPEFSLESLQVQP